MVTRKRKPLTVYEHQSIRVGQDVDGVVFERKHLDALEVFYGSGVPYFSLIHNGVKFNEFVGVIHVGNLTIEVLPKADQANDNEQWRGILLGILRVVGVFDIHAPSSATLKLKSNSILDLYLELFIIEVEALLHRGFVKQYRKEESNLTTLKGNIQFSTHIRRNIVHKERFCVKHTVYDHDHALNRILYKTINLIRQINTNPVLASRVGALLLDFPEVGDCPVSRNHFDKIVFGRKTEPYRTAISIAKLLLLNYHPDNVKGTENVLAIMFDMNLLWERFIYKSLLRYGRNMRTIEAQASKDFWKPEHGQCVGMRPDIVINKNQDECLVLDTKWKNLNGRNPSPDDLRQMFAYSEYYGAMNTALIYPGDTDKVIRGVYYDTNGILSAKSCEIIKLQVQPNIRDWQRSIADTLINSLRNQDKQ